tara:strand:+ start:816 stop:1925 length:1110 start_codon:yes stop_codon:yes gene_type:complete
MKTLQEQYNLINKGKGHKGVFMNEAKRLFPNIVPNSSTFKQTTKLLKQRNVISENIFPLLPSSGLNPFSTFDKFINEEAKKKQKSKSKDKPKVKATEKKTTKEVVDAEIRTYDYKNPDDLNNQNFDQYINGLQFEMEQDPELLASSPSESLLKAKKIVIKNLEKDPLYYIKNAAFGIKDLGYTNEAPGLTPTDITGKHKSSGYGDLKENKMSTSKQLKELLEEAVAGIPSIGNPFAQRNKKSYESKFESYLSEAEDQEEKYVGGDEKYEFEKGKQSGEKEEKKKLKKEGRMNMKEVFKEAERLGELAKRKVGAKVYEKAISERKRAMSINEDDSLTEFINQEAIREVEKEVKELEKKLMEVTADINNMG